MARYGRYFGDWNRDNGSWSREYDRDSGPDRYTGQGAWGGGYYGGRKGSWGVNRGYDFGQGYTPGRGYYGGGYGGGIYGRGGTYRGWDGGTQGSWKGGYDRDFGERVREGWNDFRQGVRRTLRGGYSRYW